MEFRRDTYVVYQGLDDRSVEDESVVEQKVWTKRQNVGYTGAKGNGVQEAHVEAGGWTAVCSWINCATLRSIWVLKYGDYTKKLIIYHKV